MKILRNVLIAVTTICLTAGLCSCTNKYQARQKTTVAEINGEKILLSNVDDQLASLVANLKHIYGKDPEYGLNDAISKGKGRKKVKRQDRKKGFIDDRKKKLQAIINEKILTKMAQENKINVNKDMKLAPMVLNGIKQKAIKEFTSEGMSDSEAEKQYKKDKDEIIGDYYDMTKLSESDFMKVYKAKILADRMSDEIEKSINVTDDEVNKYYNQHKSTYDKKAGYDIRELGFLRLDSSLGATKTMADKMYNEISEKKTSFDIQYLKVLDKKVKDSAAQLMYADSTIVDLKNSSKPEEYIKAISNLKEGESALITTKYAYYIVHLDKKRDKPKTELTDQDRSMIKTSIRSQKKENAVKEKIEEYKKKFNVKIYEDKLSF